MEQKAKKLVFENGKVYYGTGFGADVQAASPVVCHTAMAGYQELVSDPACCGQLLCMAYPLIGNYGLAEEDFESRLLFLGGLIVREYNESLANFRAAQTLGEVMEEQGVPGIQGVDTRSISKMMKANPGMKAVLCDADLPEEQALQALAEAGPENLLEKVSSRKKRYVRTANAQYNVAVVDCGVKQSTLQGLVERYCNVTVLPYNCTAEEIQALSPDALVVAGGPESLQESEGVCETLKTLLGNLPVFGIGTGHLLVAKAAGASLEALPQGHHGMNYPVRSLATGSIAITGQNHRWAVSREGLEATGFSVSHENVLDGSVEGLEDCARKIMTAQFDPLGAPGPQDAKNLFDQFIQTVSNHCKGGAQYA